VGALEQEVVVRKELLGPLAGIGFVVLVIIGFAVGGDPPDASHDAQEIFDWYGDNKGAVDAGFVIGGPALLLLVLFTNYLRRLFSAAGEAPLAPVVLVGGAILAVGFAIDATIQVAISEAVDDNIDPASAQTLQALWDNDWIPVAFGAALLLLSAGVSAVQTGALPAWLGWIAVVLGILGFTPIGEAAFLGGGLWILVTGVLLALRARGETPTPTPRAPTPPPATP
jgi:hypothetical protein